MRTDTAVRPSQLVEPGVRAPLPFGLFSVVTPVSPGADPHWEMGRKWQALACTPLKGIGDPACQGPDTPGLPKEFDTDLLDAEATAFSVYGEFACKPVGRTVEEIQGLAEQRLLTGEQAAVERILWTGELGNAPAFATMDAVDLGSVPSVLAAIGAAESYLGDLGVQGVIHVPRGLIMSVPGDRLVASGGMLRTILGTPVVAGGGYPADDRVFVTGPLFCLRSEVFTSSDRPGDLFDHGDNEMYAVAERSYLLGFDPCPMAKIAIADSSTEGV